MNKIKIGNKKIGEGEPTFIIAEAGLNHNGDYNLAKDLIDKAVDAKADSIKFIIFKTEKICSKNSGYFDTFKKLELSEEEWKNLSLYAKGKKLLFFASVFDSKSVDLVERLGVPAYKIASGDLTYIQLIKYISNKNKPIILSTGLSYLGEIEEAVNTIFSTGNKELALLHCVSSYPTKFQEVNLRVLSTLKKAFGMPIGFSDHTEGINIPIAAVAMGANIIEKHFTLNKSLPGPDHSLSLNPVELSSMVKAIRNIESALGDGIKKPSMDEKNVIYDIRRSLHANRTIEKGDIIQEDMIEITRPGNGIEPKFLDIIVGKTTKKKIKEDEIITWDKI